MLRKLLYVVLLVADSGRFSGSVPVGETQLSAAISSFAQARLVGQSSGTSRTSHLARLGNFPFVNPRSSPAQHGSVLSMAIGKLPGKQGNYSRARSKPVLLSLSARWTGASPLWATKEYLPTQDVCQLGNLALNEQSHRPIANQARRGSPYQVCTSVKQAWLMSLRDLRSSSSTSRNSRRNQSAHQDCRKTLRLMSITLCMLPESPSSPIPLEAGQSRIQHHRWWGPG
jgi:hypothetical protein